MIRATVTVRASDPDTGADFYQEHAHEHEVEFDQLGVWVQWSRNSRVFFPWGSVVRVEYGPCRCSACKPAVAA